MTTTALERFEHEYLEYHRISDGRRVEQIKTLTRLADSAGKPIENCDAADIRAFLAGEMNKGLAATTVQKKLRMIRPFFQWAFQTDLIDGTALMRIQSVPSPKIPADANRPKPYALAELRQFRAELDAAWPLVERKWWDRYERGASRYKRVASEVMRRQIEAIVALALHCGLRRAEIFAAEIDDIHPDNAYVVVRKGKGGRFREVPYTEAARETMRRWLALRASLDPGHDRPWIVAVANVADGVWLRPMGMDRFAELLTTVGDWRLHRFRHTCATTWLRAGMSLELVSRHLGHARITQTLSYAELVREDIQRAVEVNEAQFTRLLGETPDDDLALTGGPK